MKERMNIDAAEAGIYKAMNSAEKQISTFNIEKKLAELIKLRTSQINGCGYCVNLHSQDARKAGETEQRVLRSVPGGKPHSSRKLNGPH